MSREDSVTPDQYSRNTIAPTPTHREQCLGFLQGLLRTWRTLAHKTLPETIHQCHPILQRPTISCKLSRRVCVHRADIRTLMRWTSEYLQRRPTFWLHLSSLELGRDSIGPGCQYIANCSTRGMVHCLVLFLQRAKGFRILVTHHEGVGVRTTHIFFNVHVVDRYMYQEQEPKLCVAVAERRWLLKLSQMGFWMRT